MQQSSSLWPQERKKAVRLQLPELGAMCVKRKERFDLLFIVNLWLEEIFSSQMNVYKWQRAG